MQLISPIVDIAIISFVMAVISQILQRKFIDRKKMKTSQNEMKEMQKKLNELLKKNDEQSKKEATRLQNEMLKSMNETMKGSMKHMIVSLPIFWGMFAAVGFVYGGSLVQWPAAMPVLHRIKDFPFFGNFEFASGISWIWTYFYFSIAFSIILMIALKIIDNARRKKEKNPGNAELH